jgi:hypothetical protein
MFEYRRVPYNRNMRMRRPDCLEEIDALTNQQWSQVSCYD